MLAEMIEKENLLQLVLNHIPTFVFWKDRDSVYLGCNIKFAISAGFYSPEEIVGLTDYDLPWSKEDSDFYRKTDREVMESEEAFINFEEPQSVHDVNAKWLITNKIPLYDDKGAVIGILGSYEDITARKKMELELISKNEELEKLNSKLESINIDLEQFTYATSHDLQEPLRMIGGFSGLLSKNYFDKLDDEGREYLKYIKDGTQRMSLLIRQILSYSKIENSEGENVDVNLAELVKGILVDLELLIEEKNVNIEMNIPSKNIICQSHRMRMVFYNLITNGIKFNNSKSPTILLNYESREFVHYYTVSDNGIGIDEEYRESIFKPFKRLNIRDKFPGNGIGLSICNRIIAMHRGKIWSTNNIDEGTTFHFTISKDYSIKLLN